MIGRRGYWIAGMLVLVAIGAFWFWRQGGTGTESTERRGRRAAAVAVETAEVRTQTLRAIRSFFGTLQARAQYDIAPKTTGRLERLSVDIGDRIRNGQVVARLDDDEFQQQVLQARAELGVAQAGLAEAQSLLRVKQRQLERSRQLHTRGIAADAELETAQVEGQAQEARLQVAQAQVTQREAALRAAEVRLSYTVIRASWTGPGETRVIGERFANEGDLVPANQPILSLVDLDVLTAVVYATERDYPRLSVGQPAVVAAEAFGSRSFDGRIARMAPVFRESSRQARVEVELDNADGVLKPGMFATVLVEVDRAEAATSVPVSSVVTRGGAKGVFMVEGEAPQARFVPVRTGIEEAQWVQILEPALTGRVITLGNHLLSDGTTILLADAKPVPREGGDRGAGSARRGGNGSGSNGADGAKAVRKASQ